MESRASENGQGFGVPHRLRDLPSEERPRERMLRYGAPALSNRELLAILLGTGARRVSVLDVAERLQASGLHELAGRSPEDLASERGVGAAKAARILAAQIGRAHV